MGLTLAPYRNALVPGITSWSDKISLSRNYGQVYPLWRRSRRASRGESCLGWNSRETTRRSGVLATANTPLNWLETYFDIAQVLKSYPITEF